METPSYQAQENIPPQGYAQQLSHRSQGKSSTHQNQSPLYPHGTWALNPNTDPIKYRTSSPDKSLKPSQNFQSPALSISPGSNLKNATVKPFTTPKSQFISNKQDYLKPPTHRSSNSQVISGEAAQSLFDSTTLRERSSNIQDSQQRLSGSRISLDPFTSPKYNKPDFVSPKSTFDKLNEEMHLSHDERERAANAQDTKILSARKETDDFINGLLNKYGIGSMKESIETKIVSTEVYSRPKSFASNNPYTPAEMQILKSPSSYMEGGKSTNVLSQFYSPPGQSARMFYPNVYSAPQTYEKREFSQETYDIDTENLSSQLYGQTTGSIDSLESVAYNQQSAMMNTKNPYIHIDNGDYLENRKWREASVSQPNTRRTFDRTIDENTTERRHLTEEATQTIGTNQNIEEARDSENENIFDTTERRSIEGHRMVANTIEDEDNNPDGKTSESNAGSDVADMSSVVLPEEEEAIVEEITQKTLPEKESQLMNHQNDYWTASTETRTFGDVIDHNQNYETPETFRDYSPNNKQIMVDYLQPPLVHITDKENLMTDYYTKGQQFMTNQGSFPMPAQSVYSAHITNPYSSSNEEIMRQNQFKSSPQAQAQIHENVFYNKSPQRQWTFGAQTEDFDTSRFRQSNDDLKKEIEKAAELPLQPRTEDEIIQEKLPAYPSVKERESEESEVKSSEKDKEELEEEYEEVEEIIEEVEERGSVTTTGKRNIVESVKAYSTFTFVIIAIFFWYYLVSISDEWERELEARFPDI